VSHFLYIKGVSNRVFHQLSAALVAAATADFRALKAILISFRDCLVLLSFSSLRESRAALAVGSEMPDVWTAIPSDRLEV